jgi:antitoxin HigA-1
MEPVGLSAYALAKVRRSAASCKRYRAGEAPYLTGNGRAASAYFGTSDSYWINLQAHFDLEMAKDKVGIQAARISPHPHGADGTL